MKQPSSLMHEQTSGYGYQHFPPAAPSSLVLILSILQVRNIGYNLFLCTLVFLVVVFAVRFSVFFHYFGPETAKLYASFFS